MSMPNETIATSLWRFLFWLSTSVIGILSLMPIDHVPDVQVWDKLQHAAAYAWLFLAARYAYPAIAWRWPLIWLMLYGVLIEVGQYFVPGRFSSLADMVANGVGLLLSLLWFKGLVACKRLKVNNS